MEGPLTGLAVFACLVLSSLLGVVLEARLRASLHASGRLLRGAAGLIAVLSAGLVLWMVVSLKATFDTAGHEVQHFSALVVDLDRTLRRLGPEADGARELLFRYADRVMQDTWHHGAPAAADTSDLLLLGELETAIAAVPCATPPAHQAVADAQLLLQGMVESRWSLEGRAGAAIPSYALPVAVLWMMLAFGSTGLLAGRSSLAALILMLAASGFGGAVFLLEEFDRPFDGVIMVSSEPVENALFAVTD